MSKDTFNWPDDGDDNQVDVNELRYFIAGEENGTWSVYDRRTNLPAMLDEQLLAGLSFERADEMLELMNQIEKDSKPRPVTE